MPETLMEYQGAEFPETIAPTPQEAELAKESSRRLAPIRAAKHQTIKVRVQDDGESTEAEIPASAFCFLLDVLAQMSAGNAVTFIPTHAELTTQQAADVLNVSRPYLIGLIDQNKIPHRMVGKHRRVRFSDLIEYKRKTDQDRRATLAALMDQGQELKMGY